MTDDDETLYLKLLEVEMLEWQCAVVRGYQMALEAMEPAFIRDEWREANEAFKRFPAVSWWRNT
jgi:hypothetical protein